MNQVDRISKELLNLVEYSKDVVKTNLVSNNIKENEALKLTDAQLANVVRIVEASIAQGYQKGFTAFQKGVSKVLAEITETKSGSRKKQ